MRRYYEQPGYPAEQRIRDLENELYCARRAIVDLMQADISNLLMSFYSCNSRIEFARWQQVTIEKIIELAQPEPRASYFQARGYCPLCKGGSLGPYDCGFTLPEGLRRHLEGYGNTHQCPVTEAAFKMARASLREDFDEADRHKEEQTNERRRTEKVYLTELWSRPKLFDEGLWFESPRSHDQLAFAEKRLCDLGFSIETDENIVAYKLYHEPYVVLADPRANGRIEFRVCGAEKPKRHSRGRTSSFYLLDSWKNDLIGKFRDRLAKSVLSLSPEKKTTTA